MVSPFETVILNLQKMGAFQFLFPFMITAALFYGLLRRSKLFGEPNENVAVNGVVALIAAFMVWAYPILGGVNVETQLASFFFNGMVAMMTVIVAILIGGMFLPPETSFGKSLSDKLGGKVGIGVVFGIIVAILLLISSGLINAFFPASLTASLSSDVVMTAVVMIILVLGVLLIVGLPGGGKKST